MLNLTLRRKINNNQITNSLIQRLSNNGGEEMLAIFDTIDEENERIFNQGMRKGKREGKKETNIENAKKMKESNIDINLIVKITGLSKKEIQKL